MWHLLYLQSVSSEDNNMDDNDSKDNNKTDDKNKDVGKVTKIKTIKMNTKTIQSTTMTWTKFKFLISGQFRTLPMFFHY